MPVTHAPIQRILFPTDFSEFSARALRHAMALARKFHARLKIVHVIPHLLPSGQSDYFAAPWIMSPDVRPRTEDELRRFLAPLREARIDHEMELCDGDPWKEVLSAAEEMPADLVVMGTHGRSGLDHLFLGSVTEKLIRRLPCSVLTVCREEGRTWEAPGLLTRMVVATDFSETSAEALRWALGLALENGARLTVLHVVETFPDFSDPLYLSLPDLRPLREDLERVARERLEKALSDIEGAAEVNTDLRIVFGRAYKEILKAAAEERADWIVIGAQGHGMLEHLLSGSNAQHVIRAATCPVLVVRPLQSGGLRPRTQPVGLTLAATAGPAL